MTEIDCTNPVVDSDVSVEANIKQYEDFKGKFI